MTVDNGLVTALACQRRYKCPLKCHHLFFNAIPQQVTFQTILSKSLHINPIVKRTPGAWNQVLITQALKFVFICRIKDGKSSKRRANINEAIIAMQRVMTATQREGPAEIHPSYFDHLEHRLTVLKTSNMAK